MRFSKENQPLQTAKHGLPDLEEIIEQIRDSLRSQGTYSTDLELAIKTVAGAYRAYLIAQNDVSKLKKTYIRTRSREGNLRYEAHPAIKTLKDTHEMVLNGLKSLGLTMQSLVVTESNPIDRLADEFSKLED